MDRQRPKVKRLVTRLDKAEHIATDEDMVLGAYLLDTLLDEACMIAIFLHTHDPLATTRKQFERDASVPEKGRVLSIRQNRDSHG